MSQEYPYKGSIHLKHTGHELICDIIKETSAGVLHIKNPCTLQTVVTGDGSSQMAMVPYLVTSKVDEVGIKLTDVLFVTECRADVAEQHTQMFSSVILPKAGGFEI
tara:strand:- start:3406 stop:3723 length:318 start_codon:yes stop_codon:yes gene_type:complete